MEIQEIYNQFRDYYGELEAEYVHYQKASTEWESLHLRYLIYYLMRYGIGALFLFMKKNISYRENNSFRS